ncbi:hypothetical protein BDV59DRAFT_151469 [Aspergillus ambiguus]|uniref:uncharacterized protein n=1 Tax=Aspergillus ambiguus TaxID=176160 RepID=UPI003CCD68F5
MLRTRQLCRGVEGGEKMMTTWWLWLLWWWWWWRQAFPHLLLLWSPSLSNLHIFITTSSIQSTPYSCTLLHLTPYQWVVHQLTACLGGYDVRNIQDMSYMYLHPAPRASAELQLDSVRPEIVSHPGSETVESIPYPCGSHALLTPPWMGLLESATRHGSTRRDLSHVRRIGISRAAHKAKERVEKPLIQSLDASKAI